ncbi:hypothetical protein [Anaerosolibacter sp.]|uniref:hypothetical protein n=1 Tax=Anaerosolibacter sp. TaxID=1872527 RepID=UPI0039EE37B5
MDVRSLNFNIGWNVSSKPILEADKQMDKFETNVIGSTKQVGKLGEEIKDSTRNMKSFGSESQAASGVVKKLAGVMAGVFSVAAISRFTNSVTDSAASLEGYRNTLNVVMGDQKLAASTMRWAVGFANKTPFETDSIVEATVRLQSYGIQAQKTLPAIGDMAGVMNKDIMQAVEAVADAQTGELERLKEFGITKQMIIDHGNKIMRGKELVNNKGQIVDQKKFNDALFDLMEKRFKGGMEIQASSFRGITSTIVGVWKTGLAQMAGISADGEIRAGSFFDTLKKKSIELSNQLNEMASDGTFERMGTVLVTSLEFGIEAFETFGDAIGYVKDNADWLIPTLGGLAFGFGTLKVIGFVTNLTKAYGATMLGMKVANDLAKGSIIGTNAALLVQKAITLKTMIATQGLWATMVANPIGPIVIGVAALTAGIIYLYKNWDKVTESIKKAWEWLTKWNDKQPKAQQTEYGYVSARDSAAPVRSRQVATKQTAAPIPKLASGGIVSSPTLAMVGDNRNASVDPEVVSPLSNLKDMIGQKNDSSVVFSPQISIAVSGGGNADEVARVTRRELEKMFPDLMEEFFEMLARKKGLVLE